MEERRGLGTLVWIFLLLVAACEVNDAVAPKEHVSEV